MRLRFLASLVVVAFTLYEAAASVQYAPTRAATAHEQVVLESPIKCEWLPVQPTELQIWRGGVLDDAGEVIGHAAIFNVGTLREVVVVGAINGESGIPNLTVYTIVVPDAPEPPDPVDPDDPPEPPLLSDYSKQVRDAAKTADQPEVAVKVGNIYGGVASQIGAGTIRNLPDARTAIATAMKAHGPLDSAWEPCYLIIRKSFNEGAQSLADAQRMCSETAAGLFAAARGN